ncbi:hypothetical protein D3C73_1373370 [compost metagenome]
MEEHGAVLGAARQARGHINGVVLAFVEDSSRRSGGSFPRVPDALGGLHERFGMFVTVGVVQVSAAAEVRTGPGVVRGHNVPRGPASGDQVQ